MDIAVWRFGSACRWRRRPADRTYPVSRQQGSSKSSTPAVSAQELQQSGMALVCSDETPHWLPGAAAWAAQNPASRRIDTEITRNFLGIPGQPHHYVIFIIPPRP
jgi:hypothetical protein